MEDKNYFVFRFTTQERATNYLNKVVKQFDDYILYTDMTDKSVEFDDSIYFFWEMIRDDGIEFQEEYDEKDFHKVVGELMKRYQV